MLGGGAGHIQDMINRMKNNRNQLRSQKRRNPKEQLKFKSNITFSEKTLCPEKVARVKKEILKEAKKEQNKNRMINLAIFLVSLLIVFALIQWFLAKLNEA